MRSSCYGLGTLCIVLLLSGCTKSTFSRTTPGTQQKPGEQQCYQMFSALKTLDNASFKRFQQQFSIINHNYEVYKKNQALIDNDSAEIIKLELNEKVDVVCARVRSAVFASMAKRASDLNKL